MSEPTRFLQYARRTRASELLEAGLDDGPRPEALGRAAAAIGVTLGAAAVAAPVSAAIHGAAGSAMVAGKASGTSTLVLGKWLLSGILGGMLVSGTATVVERARAARVASGGDAVVAEANGVRTSAKRRQAHAALPSETPSVAEATENPPSLDGENADNGAGSEPSGAASRAPAVTSGSLASPESSASRALGVEAARIDGARRALASGDVRRALTELDWYERSRVVGVLDREAELLRIQALVQGGDGPRAVELARAYLASHQHDAYTARLNELIARGGSVFPAG
ncbi:MAG TPA: hypothetical protein VGQ57_11895, partial [Polyangiaceae bacterium]|nr:hypothetical protein [Polyangiaceae bacterium]